MQDAWVVLAALAIGAFLGAGFVVILIIARERGEQAQRVVNPVVPEGVDQVIAALDSAGIVLDPSNNVVRASPGALSLGLVRGLAVTNPELLRLAGLVRADGETVQEEIEVPRGPYGDASVTLLVRVARLGTRFVLLLAEDRTEAKRLDAVRRDFIANISHELKTPIASVGLLAEAVDQAADEPERVRRFASRLSEESSRLARITNEVIQLTRLQANDAVAERALLDLDEIVAVAIDQNRVLASGKRIELALRTRSKARVWGDRELLIVAVHNLVANAIAYSPEGGRIGIGTARRDGIVEISVTDQGIGIPEEDLDRVFERFYRVDQARSRHTGGTGLGLAIVKHTAEEHGGDVRAWSTLGRGSTFTIRLPEAASAADAADAGAERPRPRRTTA
ncbi:sensor histidine kinase [Agromyces seonyuensis]|uniref:Sensor-like histidine kinase SenX3 n=1 Tax=Agromyces seonyuensis TaxID=2662446 RepID=A0A6I4NZ50_9MICO|nr:ATP-binding protein [Agromyces seonyuensis]MWB97715.1 two-component sensor histidine kinase [Agromyces seonyuensis]